MSKYLDEIEADEGSIYENDFITKVIENTLLKLKADDPSQNHGILVGDEDELHQINIKIYQLHKLT